MIVKTEEDPLKEADIMVENLVDHVIMEVWDNKEHFVLYFFRFQVSSKRSSFIFSRS